MTAYIYSTLSQDQNYTDFHRNERGDMVTPIKSIFIKGGANVRVYDTLFTPMGRINEGDTPVGSITQVSDEDLEFLEKNNTFQVHVKNGFIKIDKKKIEVEKAVKDLKSGDDSQQKTPTNLPNFRPSDKK